MKIRDLFLHPRLPQDRWEELVRHMGGLAIFTHTISRLISLHANKLTDVHILYCTLFAALIVFILMHLWLEYLCFSPLHSRMLALSCAAFCVFASYVETMPGPTSEWVLLGLVLSFMQMLYWYSAGPSPYGWSNPFPEPQKSS